MANFERVSFFFSLDFNLFIFHPLLDRVNIASLNTNKFLLERMKFFAFIFFEGCVKKRLPMEGVVEIIDQSAPDFWQASIIRLNEVDRKMPLTSMIEIGYCFSLLSSVSESYISRDDISASS